MSCQEFTGFLGAIWPLLVLGMACYVLGLLVAEITGPKIQTAPPLDAAQELVAELKALRTTFLLSTEAWATSKAMAEAADRSNS